MKIARKLFALALALCMVCTLSVTAFAYDDMGTVTISKTYEAPNGGVSPAETFNFTIEATSVAEAAETVTVANMPVPTIAAGVTYAAGDAGKDGAKTKDITVTLPTNYSSVGIYTYTIKETAGNTAGVTYRSEDIILKVTVIEENGQKRVAAVHTENPIDVSNANGKKSSGIENKYEAGTLAVKKTVTGNLGDKQKEFNVKVTFNAPAGKTVKEAISYVEDGTTKTIDAGNGWTGSKEVTLTLKHDETVTFTNIPYGVTYTVVEDDYTSEKYDAASYNFSDTGKKIDSASDTVEITNNKSGEVDTGVVLDSLPYVMILAVAAFGCVALVMKKRYTV